MLANLASEDNEIRSRAETDLRLTTTSHPGSVEMSLVRFVLDSSLSSLEQREFAFRTLSGVCKWTDFFVKPESASFRTETLRQICDFIRTVEPVGQLRLVCELFALIDPETDVLEHVHSIAQSFPFSQIHRLMVIISYGTYRMWPVGFWASGLDDVCIRHLCEQSDEVLRSNWAQWALLIEKLQYNHAAWNRLAGRLLTFASAMIRTSQSPSDVLQTLHLVMIGVQRSKQTLPPDFYRLLCEFIIGCKSPVLDEPELDALCQLIESWCGFMIPSSGLFSLVFSTLVSYPVELDATSLEISATVTDTDRRPRISLFDSLSDIDPLTDEAMLELVKASWSAAEMTGDLSQTASVLFHALLVSEATMSHPLVEWCIVSSASKHNDLFMLLVAFEYWNGSVETSLGMTDPQTNLYTALALLRFWDTTFSKMSSDGSLDTFCSTYSMCMKYLPSSFSVYLEDLHPSEEVRTRVLSICHSFRTFCSHSVSSGLSCVYASKTMLPWFNCAAIVHPCIVEECHSDLTRTLSVVFASGPSSTDWIYIVSIVRCLTKVIPTETLPTLRTLIPMLADVVRSSLDHVDTSIDSTTFVSESFSLVQDAVQAFPSEFTGVLDPFFEACFRIFQTFSDKTSSTNDLVLKISRFSAAVELLPSLLSDEGIQWDTIVRIGNLLFDNIPFSNSLSMYTSVLLSWEAAFFSFPHDKSIKSSFRDALVDRMFTRLYTMIREDPETLSILHMFRLLGILYRMGICHPDTSIICLPGPDISGKTEPPFAMWSDALCEKGWFLWKLIASKYLTSESRQLNTTEFFQCLWRQNLSYSSSFWSSSLQPAMYSLASSSSTLSFSLGCFGFANEWCFDPRHVGVLLDLCDKAIPSTDHFVQQNAFYLLRVLASRVSSVDDYRLVCKRLEQASRIIPSSLPLRYAMVESTIADALEDDEDDEQEEESIVDEDFDDDGSLVGVLDNALSFIAMCLFRSLSFPGVLSDDVTNHLVRQMLQFQHPGLDSTEWDLIVTNMTCFAKSLPFEKQTVLDQWIRIVS